MNYFIVNNRVIEQSVNSIEDFVQYVKSKNPSAIYVKRSTATNIEKFDTDKYQPGSYIVHKSNSNNDLMLVEKVNIVNEGYFYNSMCVKLNIKNEWSLLKNDSVNDSLHDSADDSANDSADDSELELNDLYNKMANNCQKIRSIVSNYDSMCQKRSEHIIDLKKIDLNKIIKCATILVICDEPCQKIDDMQEIVDFIANRDCISEDNMLICETDEDSRKIWQEMFSRATIYKTHTDIHVNDLFDKQLLSHKGASTCMVTDAANDPKIINGILMDNVILKARHYGTNVVVSANFRTYVKIQTRSCFDIVLLYDIIGTKKSNTINEFNKLYDYYGEMFPNRRTFYKTLKHYSKMAIIRSVSSNKIKHTVFRIN